MKKISTPHDDENPELGSSKEKTPSLLAADDEIDPSFIDQLYTSGKHIPRRGENTERWD